VSSSKGRLRAAGLLYNEPPRPVILEQASMRNLPSVIVMSSGLLVLALTLLGSACQREPEEGRYDREHHRQYHDHRWRDCDARDERCR